MYKTITQCEEIKFITLQRINQLVRENYLFKVEKKNSGFFFLSFYVKYFKIHARRENRIMNYHGPIIQLQQFSMHEDFLYVYYLFLILILEKAMTTHSSTLDWKIPWTEELGGHNT